MVVAGHAQVARIADICAKLDLMVAQNLCPIVHELELVFLLYQWTVAAVHAQSEPEVADAAGGPDFSGVLAIAARISNKVRRLAGGEGIAKIETRNADVRGWGCAHAIRNDVYVISDVTEAEVGEHRRTHGIVEPARNALIATLGLAAESSRTESNASQSAKHCSANQAVVGIAVAPKAVDFRSCLVVNANVYLVFVENAGAAEAEVVEQSACIRCGKLVEQLDRRCREAIGRNAVAGANLRSDGERSERRPPRSVRGAGCRIKCLVQRG